MRRLGAILMIFGVNIAVGSLVAAFWRASVDCALEAVDGACEGGVATFFVRLMLSGVGLVYWLVVVLGLLLFWGGRKLRLEGR